MNNKPYQGVQRRANYRLEYPPSKAPRIMIGGTSYEVIDISERGIRIQNPFRHRMPDDMFTAMVHFHEGEPVKVIARMVRIEPGRVALYLIQGIPYKRILIEQTYVKKTD